MYESFFALRCRPFSATPNPECYVPVPATDAALGEMCATVKGGQGIAVLTAPAGLGKTLVCLRLASSLGDDFSCVWLPTANYCTRRSLLQAILYELGRPYAQMAEQELRLQLISTARTLASRNRAVVVIADEAHLLSPRLLEELRGLTNVVAAGRTLIRVVLSGQLQLEETLAEPEMSALNQRVDCQVTLVPLTGRESLDYLATRLRWAGGQPEAVFTPEASDLICRVSDGQPRCLNQLADHALELACSQEQRPATAATVRRALDELKQLPLHWSDSPVSGDSPDTESRSGAAADCALGSVVETWTPPAATHASFVEVGADSAGGPQSSSREPVRRDTARVVAPAACTANSPCVPGLIEEPVVDRYAMLDAGLVPPAAVTVSHDHRRHAIAADTQDAVWFDLRPEERQSSGLEFPAHDVDVFEFEPYEPPGGPFLDGVVPLLEATIASTGGFEIPPQLVRSAAGPRHEVLSTDVDLERQIETLVRETADEVGGTARAAAIRPGADRCREADMDQVQGLLAAGGDAWSDPAATPPHFDWADQARAAAEPPAGGFDIVLPDDDAAGFAEDAATVPLPGRGRIEREDAPKAACPPRHYAQLFSELRRRQRERT